MPRDHPDRHLGYELRTELVLKMEAFKNKEDSHGGPGYYPVEQVIVRTRKEIAPSELPQTVERIINNQGE
jgi:hypothetical protein